MNEAYFAAWTPPLLVPRKRPRRPPIRRDTKAFAKSSARFVARVRALVVELGGMAILHLRTPDQEDLWLATPVGGLVVVAKPEGIYGFFDRPESAARAVGCNPFSGKWHHHIPRDAHPGPEHAERFEAALRALMALDPVTLRPRAR